MSEQVSFPISPNPNEQDLTRYPVGRRGIRDTYLFRVGAGGVQYGLLFVLTNVDEDETQIASLLPLPLSQDIDGDSARLLEDDLIQRRFPRRASLEMIANTLLTTAGFDRKQLKINSHPARCFTSPSALFRQNAAVFGAQTDVPRASSILPDAEELYEVVDDSLWGTRCGAFYFGHTSEANTNEITLIKEMDTGKELVPPVVVTHPWHQVRYVGRKQHLVSDDRQTHGIASPQGLAPCPFCGGTTIQFDPGVGGVAEAPAFLSCVKCGCKIEADWPAERGKIPDALAAKWNKRAIR